MSEYNRPPDPPPFVKGQEGDSPTIIINNIMRPEVPEQQSAKPPSSRRGMLKTLMVGAGLSLMLKKTVEVISYYGTDNLEKWLVAQGYEYKILAPESSPKNYNAYTKMYDKLMEIVPAAKKAGLIKPNVFVYKSGDDNAFHLGDDLSEKSAVGISSKLYVDGDPAELEQLYGHELGHWLIRYDRALAEEISGINHPAIAPLMAELKQKMSRIFTAPEAREKYKDLRDELICDGIGVRLTCNPAGAISLFERFQRKEQNELTRRLLGERKFSTEDEKTAQKKVFALIKEIQTLSAMTHPENEMRERFVNLVSKNSCRDDRTPSRTTP